MASAEIRKQLMAPFPPEDIEWRIQTLTKDGKKALVLAYITSRAVQERLDNVLGIDGWQDRYERWGDNGVYAELSLRLNDEWVTKGDGAEDTDIEAVKGGFSGALKRAAVKWGIGRYLYHLENTWVDMLDKGEIYGGYNKDLKKNLYFNRPSLPKWALPPNTQPQQATGPQSNGQTKAKANKEQFELIAELARELNLGKSDLKDLANDLFGKGEATSLTFDEAQALIAKLEQDAKARDEEFSLEDVPSS